MAQPAVISGFGRAAVRRADGHALPLLDEVAFALNDGRTGAYDDAWRPAKSLIYVFGSCGMLWAGAVFAYLTFH